MTNRFSLRDGRLTVHGQLSWPADSPVSAERAVASVWQLIPTLQSTRMACGYVARELNIDPVLLLATVQHEQSKRQTCDLPEGLEPHDTTENSMITEPDGTLVRISGEIFGLQRRVTGRGQPWVTFALGQKQSYFEVMLLPTRFAACDGTSLIDDITVTVEGRKWFTEETRIHATKIVPQ